MSSPQIEPAAAAFDAASPPTNNLRGDILLLSLLGAVGPAQPLALEFLTVRDRVQLPLVSKTMRQHLTHLEYHHCQDGQLYTVPYPGFPGILWDHNHNLKNTSRGLFPHQLASLAAMHRAENASQEYGSLRGGVLADAPGLGKTITLLSLVASTAGQFPKTPAHFWNNKQLQQGWQALCQNPACGPEIIRLLNCFQAFHVKLKFRQRLAQYVLPPVPADRFRTIHDFERYIKKTLQPMGATQAEFESFRQQLVQVQARLHKSNRKLIQSPQGRRLVWERQLVPTSATLIIVPDPLLEHWYQQISWNLHRDLFADEDEQLLPQNGHSNGNVGEGRGVVYLDGVGDIADARMPLGEVHLTSSTTLPLPGELAKYLIVVTTFSRCRQEWKKERQFANSLSGSKRKVSGNIDEDEFDHDLVHIQNNKLTRLPCSLLQMRWLRIVVDEGHELGNNTTSTNQKNNHQGDLTRFVHQLAAERRWVLSGTPTTGNEDDKEFSSEALDQLQRLMLFLRHPVYGTVPPPKSNSNNTGAPFYAPTTKRNQKSGGGGRGKNRKQQAKALWESKVKELFLKQNESGRQELLRVLKETVVMHRKEDIHLPEPIFRDADIDIPIPSQIQQRVRDGGNYAQALLSQYLCTDDFQTLVDAAQADSILKAIESAKVGVQKRGGALEVDRRSFVRLLTAEDRKDQHKLIEKDRRPIKAVVYSSNKNNLRDVTEVLYAKLDWENIAEAYDDPRYDCSAELSRFRHGQKEFRTCPICGFHNDYTGTAQPNRRNSKPLCQRTLMEVCLRRDNAVRFLVEPERVVRALPVGLGGNVTQSRLDGLPASQYGSHRRKWRTGDILEVDIRDPHPLLRARESNDTWRQTYGANTCEELAKEDSYQGQDWYFGELPEVEGNEEAWALNERASPAMEVVLVKFQQCHNFHRPSRWYKGPTLADAPLESRRENAFILSLDAGLSHGLDLSFVTHIFLLEPVDDAALLEQITSRAHRLGATGPVTVETVNPYYKLDKATEEAIERCKQLQQTSSPNEHRQAKHSIKSKEKNSLTKVICQHCYRHFDSMEAAVEHEEKQCPRNPANVDVVDRWHLSSVYRELQPPPPQESSLYSSGI